MVTESVWKDVGRALRGERHDYTAGPLKRGILLLAVPMVLELAMESLFALVDVFWVSRLGREAVAVVGLTEAVMSLIYAVAMGISFAATAIVARRIGEKNPEFAAHAAGQVLLIGALASTALGLAFGCFAADVLRLMGADASVVVVGTDFAHIMLGGNATVFMIFLINAIFRGAGDPALAMRTLWLANALNIVLGPLFIFGWGPFPELGVTGAAVATTIGRGVGVLYQLYHLFGRRGQIRVQLRHLRPAFGQLRAIVGTASSGVAQLLITMTSWIGLIKILAVFGSAALAGFTIAIRVVNFAMLIAWGIANASATLVGQNLGARKPERARAAVVMAVRLNILLLSAAGAIFVVFSRPLIHLFTDDPAVIAAGANALLIISLGLPVYGAGNCFAAAFNGAGDTWTPARLNFVCFWLGQIPLAWVLTGTFNFGPAAIFVSVLLSFSAAALWSGILFRRGSWKLQQV
jgi:putative MATE family efflux protein